MEIPHLSKREAQILELLVGEPDGMYGLEMVRTSPKLKRGTVYVTLNRMAEKGLVESRKEDRGSEGGLPRRVFTVAAHGQRVWEAHVAAQRVMAQGEAWAT